MQSPFAMLHVRPHRVIQEAPDAFLARDTVVHRTRGLRLLLGAIARATDRSFDTVVHRTRCQSHSSRMARAFCGALVFYQWPEGTPRSAAPMLVQEVLANSVSE